MAKKIYEYACHACKVSWEREYEFAKPAKKTKCPDCGKRCGQNWLNRDAPPVHFKGSGWTGQNSGTGFNKSGGSDEVNKQLQDHSKLRQESGWQHYAKYTPPQKLLDTARKLTPQEVQQKLEASKKVSDEVYDKAKINPYEQNKKKPQ